MADHGDNPLVDRLKPGWQQQAFEVGFWLESVLRAAGGGPLAP